MLPDQRAAVIMGQRESTINLSDILSEGLVLLVSTAQGTIGVGPAALMGGTMVSLIESAIRDQEHMPADKRAKCLLVCDEFQTVTGANWEGMLAESRKYGLQPDAGDPVVGEAGYGGAEAEGWYSWECRVHSWVPDVRGGRPDYRT